MKGIVMAVELKPCPFCGKIPKFEECYGTCYDISCDECGQSVVSIQICDLMTIAERMGDEFIDMRYGEEFIGRAKKEATERWNKRI